MITAICKGIISQIHNQYILDSILEDKPNMNELEKKAFFNHVMNIDYLIEGFRLNENYGFAYKLPNSLKLINALKKEYLPLRFSNSSSGEIVSEIGIINAPSGTYLQLERIKE